MRLLLVEDEEDAARMIAKGLRQEGYFVDVANDGQAGLESTDKTPYSLIILDVRLPVKDGWTVCRELRERQIHTPVLMLTALGATDDRIKGLDLGADDYLVKPFDLGELLARVRALLRRRPLFENPLLTVDTLVVNTRSRTVSRAGKPVRLTAKEYALLECLAREADTLLTRDDISEQVWNTAYEPFSNLIEEYIKRLRKKIDFEGELPLIHSRRGEGYILTAKELGGFCSAG
ncbi:MAG TPA: response regulator transcription factor [Bryobacteraceae bacterium]|nr:response regulator transcription factor [Bryobacteraceae bacterium]